jgi:anti-anti-sigma factor
VTIQVTFLEDDIWSVAPQGRVDTAGARSFEEALIGLFDEGHTRVVVDCTDVVYMASAGLRVLMIGLRRAKTAGGAISLAAVNPTVLQAFKMSGLDQLFAVYAGVPEAVASLRRLSPQA